MIMRALAIAIASSLALASAHAQPAADPGQAAYEEGKRLYDKHQWESAIAQFKESYRLRRDAASLFNIAQAYRLTGDCFHAVEFYRQYKQDFPDAANIAKVDKFIAELETCAKEHEPHEQPTTPQPNTQPIAPQQQSVQPLPPPPPVDTGHSKRLAGLAIAGTGVVAVATGFYFGHLASADADQVHNGTGVWDPGVESAGKRDDLIAKVLWGVGGAAIVGGTVMYVLGRGGEEAPRVGVVPTRGGASLVWGCGF
jgi:tetratricopeptide (TPR) repeat protein